MLDKINSTPEEVLQPDDEKELLPGENKESEPKLGECWCSCNTCDIYNSHCHNSLTGCRVPKHIRA